MAKLELGLDLEILAASRACCKTQRANGRARRCNGSCGNRQGLAPGADEDCPRAFGVWSPFVQATLDSAVPSIRRTTWMEYEEKVRIKVDLLKRNKNSSAVKFMAEALEIILEQVRHETDSGRR